jgi:hypothetical protein
MEFSKRGIAMHTTTFMKYLPVLCIVFTLLLVTGSASTIAATRTSTATGGVWGTTTTWVGGVVPIATDLVVIATTGAGSVQGNETGTTYTCAGLTINSDATLTMYRPLIVNGTTSITGTINFGSTTGTTRAMAFNGAVTLNSGARWNETTTGAAATFSFSNSFTNNATTFTAQNTAHNFTGAAMTLSGSTATVIPTVTFTGAYSNNGTLTVATLLTVTGTTLTNNGTITASTALSGTGGVTQGSTGILNIGGTAGITNLTATSSGNTVNYTGAAQTAKVTTYYDLVLSGSGVKTFATTPTVNGTLTMAGTATVTVTTGVVTYGANATLRYYTATARTSSSEEWITPFAATGGVLIDSTGTITLDAAKVLNASVPLTIDNGATLSTGANNYNITIGGNWTNNGTFTAGTSTTTFTGSAQTIGGTSNTTFGTLVIASGAACTMNNNNTCAALTFASAGAANSLTHGTTSTLTINGAVTLNAPSADNTTTAWNINTGSATVSGSVTLNAGTADSRVTQINITTGTLDVAGSISLTNTTSDIRTAINISGAGNIYIAGNLGSTGSFGTISPGSSSTITFDGSNPQSISLVGHMFFNNVVVNKPSGTATFSILQGPYYEAENATMVGPVFANDHPGYSGTGFADYINPTTDYIEWTVNAGTAISTELSFRYALDSTDRPLELRVNGVVADPSMPFPRTSFVSWSDYSTVQSVPVNLIAGANTIRLTAIGQSGANMDYLTVGSINSVVLGDFSVLSGTATITNSFMVDGYLTVFGTLDLSTFSMNGNSSGKALTLGSAGVLLVGGTSGGATGSNFPAGYNGTPSINASGRVMYNGTAQQAIANSILYGILEVNNAAGVNLTNGTVTASTLAMTNGTMTTGANIIRVTGSRTGNGLVNGSVRHIHGFSLNTNYSFEGPNTFISIQSRTTFPDSITITSYPNTPITVGPQAYAIRRYYDITQHGGIAVSSTLRLHYDTAERNGLTEALFTLWRYNGTAWEDKLFSSRSTGTANSYVEQTGITQFSQWTIGEGAGPLPVQLTSFTASAKKFDITLEWKTASEKNNYGFDIERQSADGIWTKIGFIGGNGSTTIPREYTYTDRNAPPGQLKYRLKQTDFDGAFEYSSVVEVVSGATDPLFMLGQNYPSPFNPITTIEFSIRDDSPTTLKVYNMLGQEVATLIDGQSLSSGLIHRVTFDGRQLSSGTYYYILNSGKYSAVKKMILLK